jgi:hypothetical protein
VLAVARSATAVKCDGYLKPRARQVQQLVLQRFADLDSEKRGTSTEFDTAVRYPVACTNHPGDSSCAQVSQKCAKRSARPRP